MRIETVIEKVLNPDEYLVGYEWSAKDKDGVVFENVPGKKGLARAIGAGAGWEMSNEFNRVQFGEHGLVELGDSVGFYCMMLLPINGWTRMKRERKLQ